MVSGLSLGGRDEPGWGLVQPSSLIGHPGRPSCFTIRPSRELLRVWTAKAEPSIL